MAKVVESISDATTSRRRYPWNEWLDGQAWMLVKGEDFDMPVETFRGYVYSVASERGVKAKTRLVRNDDVDALVIQTLDGKPVSSNSKKK